MTAYYNENDPFAAAWLRNLIADNLIAQGEVDERSIVDVRPSDLGGFSQCHFFAGIGVWSYALRQAGWPDDRPVWTGSCPCQSFSAAGARKGFDDKRHLWPEFFRLIRQSHPDTILGEQVASKDALAWLDLVSSDLEGEDYAIGAVDTCAAGFGAPHIRQRLWWVADSTNSRRQEARQHGSGPSLLSARPAEHGGTGGMEHSSQQQMGFPRRAWESRSSDDGLGEPSSGRLLPWRPSETLHGTDSCCQVERPSDDGGLDLTNCRGSSKGDGSSTSNGYGHPSQPTSFWSECSWLPCIDGKARPVKPGTFPLAHGVTNRVGTLRGYGNALVAPQAQAFIESYMEI